VRVRRQSRELTEEAAAFLQGGLAMERARHGARPQDWEWVNFLAHSSPVQLARLSAHPYAFARVIRDEEWWGALIYLTERILHLCQSTGASLEDVQRTALVPLELELAARSALALQSGEPPRTHFTAAQTVDQVVSRLSLVPRRDER
jgi:hypothetical protein